MLNCRYKKLNCKVHINMTCKKLRPFKKININPNTKIEITLKFLHLPIPNQIYLIQAILLRVQMSIQFIKIMPDSIQGLKRETNPNLILQQTVQVF